MTAYSNCTNGEVRLVNGATENEGRVEVCYGNVWGTVCDDYWHTVDANVVCHQLGHQPTGKHWILCHEVAYSELYVVLFTKGATVYYSAYFGQGTGPIFIHQLTCAGSESSLFQCYWTAYRYNYRCSHSEDAGVRCAGIILYCCNTTCLLYTSDAADE